tara:strand:+ start:8549 stop:8848 length:300 start_codon:yes stop_codon:yes gene_type:complete
MIIKKNLILIIKPIKNPNEIVNDAKKRLDVIEIFPDAIGLYFFLGCFLSYFKSRISFRIYRLEATKLKERKAKKQFLMLLILKENDAIIGKKIRQFFKD